MNNDIIMVDSQAALKAYLLQISRKLLTRTCATTDDE